MPQLSDQDAAFYLPFFVAAAEEFEITTRSRVAAFIGNGAYESGEMRFMEEIGGSNKEYAPYYGRGFMQLTGVGNYRAASQYFNTDFVSQPDLVSHPEWAFRTAAWFFRNGNGDQATFADAGDFWQCYVRTVGADNGTFPQRRAYYDRTLRILPATITTDDDTTEGQNVVTGQDIVDAAREVLGAPYRTWYPGNSIPMWLDDNVSAPPSASHLMRVGVECSDLINYALERNNLDPVYGTEALLDTIKDYTTFDASRPGQAGAVAFTPYSGPDLSQQGHIVLYTGAHSTIQALPNPGVTEDFDDIWTNAYIGLTYYGFLPGVDYSAHAAPDGDTTAAVTPTYWIAINKDGVLVANGQDFSRGWYDVGYKYNDFPRWHGPKEK